MMSEVILQEKTTAFFLKRTS